MGNIANHTLAMFEKPAAGNNFMKQFQTYNYRHTIDSIGGFDTASCDIAIRSRDEGLDFLDQYLGNRVAIYVDNPVEPVWEGFINRMTFNAGGVQYSISLDEMANRVRCISTQTAGSTTTTQTAVANDTASQAVYGIKQEQVDLGFMLSGTGNTILRDTVLAQRAWPKTSVVQGTGSGGLLNIEMLGFYHTLMWEDYRNTGTGSVQLGTFVDTILGGLVNGTTFFDSADVTETVANTNAIDINSIRGETVWDIFTKIQETGNTTNYFVIGITPTLFSTGTRRLYYRTASTTITYTARQSDGLRIRNLYGQIVPPWMVRPDTGIKISDMLIGWDGLGDNPTETYIKTIDYDANRQLATWRGDDDKTAEGSFQFKRFNKPYGKRFGQGRRVA